jgi:hypothetical protein
MPQNFIDCDREQAFLMPPSLRDWLPGDHLAWFVIDAVGRLDLSAFYAAYRADGHGRAAYEPSVMGWIQPVVATLDDEELRCPEETPLWIVPLQQGRVASAVRLLGAENIGFDSGRCQAPPKIVG